MIKFLKFLTSKAFLIQLILMALLVGIVLGGVLFWLKIYTNHGQSLELPNYVDMAYDEAIQDAEDRSFEIIVNDSIHLVNKPGGLIIDQNPQPSSRVKENRKIYVTTTKYTADIINFDDISTLYGTRYETKSNELSYLDLKTEIRSEKFDAGEPGYILEVWYEGQMVDSRKGRAKDIKIEKGSTLQFVISKNYGAQLNIPDLRCKTLSEARFLISNSKLQIGEIKTQGDVSSNETAFIVDQMPRPGSEDFILQNSAINLILVAEKPKDCK